RRTSPKGILRMENNSRRPPTYDGCCARQVTSPDQLLNATGHVLEREFNIKRVDSTVQQRENRKRAAMQHPRSASVRGQVAAGATAENHGRDRGRAAPRQGIVSEQGACAIAQN